MSAIILSPVTARKKISELSDCEIITLSQNNDERAFAMLMKRYERMVYGMLRNWLPIGMMPLISSKKCPFVLRGV